MGVRIFDFQEEEKLADALETIKRINARLDEITKNYEDMSHLLRMVLKTRAVICPTEK